MRAVTAAGAKRLPNLEPIDLGTASRVLIVGLGKTGLSVARFLAKQGIRFAVVDSRDVPPGLDELRKHHPDAAVFVGGFEATAFAAATHPTQPESFSKRDKVKLAQATKKLLGNWNLALQALQPAIAHPDVEIPLVPYGDTWAEGDRMPILERDFPAGLPAWMHEQDGWAKRSGQDDLAKRRNITITVPKGIVG